MITLSSQLDSFLKTIRMKGHGHPQLPAGDFLKMIRIKVGDHRQLPLGQLPEKDQNKRR
jgi:hypothetical protein